MHLASEAIGPNFLLMPPPALNSARLTPLKLQTASDSGSAHAGPVLVVGA